MRVIHVAAAAAVLLATRSDASLWHVSKGKLVGQGDDVLVDTRGYI